MTVCTWVSPENITMGANTPTMLKITPASRARSTTRSLRRPNSAAATRMQMPVNTASTRPAMARPP